MVKEIETGMAEQLERVHEWWVQQRNGAATEVARNSVPDDVRFGHIAAIFVI